MTARVENAHANPGLKGVDDDDDDDSIMGDRRNSGRAPGSHDFFVFVSRRRIHDRQDLGYVVALCDVRCRCRVFGRETE